MESELMGDALLEKITQIRGDFPFYGKSMDDPDYWIFLDNAATTHKPRCVLDAITDFYVNYNANIHRGLYELSEKATSAYEEARKRIAGFIGARSDAEVVFTRGATESINLIASCWGGQNLAKGDFILVSEMEHHANIVPWQLVAEATGAEVLPIPIDDVGNLDLSFAEEKIKSGQVKCLSLVHVSNAIGVRVDVEPLVKLAKANGVFTLIDGSQALSHFAVNVTDLDCDAYVFSGHKLFGPTGIGILWAREEILKAIPPYQGGGDMIHRVSFEGTTFSEPPSKFEAGTPHISGAIGLGRAVEYVQSIGYQTIAEIDELLLKKATEIVESVPGLERVGKTDHQIGVLSFYPKTVHPSDLATFLGTDHIAVRTGHHCAQPLMDRMGIAGTVRMSFSIYNHPEELERVRKSLEKAMMLLG